MKLHDEQEFILIIYLISLFVKLDIDIKKLQDEQEFSEVELCIKDQIEKLYKKGHKKNEIVKEITKMVNDLS